MEVVHVQEPNEIVDKRGKFLTFKQSEKFQLQKLGFDCSTVHEYQGKQGPVVSIFRASPREAEFIYKSEPHMLVATTRHTKKLTYYTNCVTDPLSQLIGKRFEVRELESAYVPNKETKERRLVDVLKGLHLRGGADLITSNEEYLPDWRWKINDRVDHRFIDVAYYAHQEQYAPEELELMEKKSNEIRSIRNKLRCENPRVEILQDWYDSMLPGNSLHDDLEKNNYKINTQDFMITVDSVEIDPTRGTHVEPKYDPIRPVLRTACPPAKPVTLPEMLRGFAGRNSNVPKVSDLRSVNELIKEMTSKFIETCIDPSKKALFYEYQSNPITVNMETISHWRETTTSRPTPELTDFLSDMSLDKYEYLSKCKVKPDLTTNAPYKLSAGQMIACHGPEVNVFFGPIFKEVKEWDLKVMEIFGVHPDIMQLWRVAHERTRLIDRQTGMRANVTYQRKSGDAYTFMGNTMYLLGVFAVIYPIHRLVALLIGGDDTLAIGDGVRRDTSSIFGAAFNLEAKLLNYNSWYFCSKFMVYSNGKYHLVPDPVKLITKLGRTDLVNWEHVEEYRVSLKDLCSVFNDVTMVEKLNYALEDRYPSDVADHTCMISNLLEMLKTSKSFCKLYYSLPGDKLCQDPLRPKLE